MLPANQPTNPHLFLQYVCLSPPFFANELRTPILSDGASRGRTLAAN